MPPAIGRLTRAQIMHIWPKIGAKDDRKIAKAMEWFQHNGIEPRNMAHVMQVAEML